MPPVVKDDTQKDYLRCCICCRQPWQCDTDTAGELATYVCFGMQKVYKDYNTDKKQRRYKFAQPVQKSHTIQKVQQADAVEWACESENLISKKKNTVYTMKVVSDNTKHYEAAWKLPQQFIKLDALQQFVIKNTQKITKHTCLPETVLACKTCNMAMDTRQTCREVLYGDNKSAPGIIPSGLITIMGGRTKTENVNLLLNAQNSTIQMCIGAFEAWYLHSTYIHIMRDIDKKRHTKLHEFVVMSSWLTLMVFCKWKHLTNKDDDKEYPKYVCMGLVDLFVSMFMYVLVNAKYQDFDIPFARFHVFYFLEIAECTHGSFWDKAKHPCAYNYITDDIPVARPFRVQLNHMASNLIEFYEQKITPVVEHAIQQKKNETYLYIEQFFINKTEIDFILAHLPSEGDAAKDLSLQAYMDVLGTKAVLRQCWKYAVHTKPLQKAIENWILFFINEFDIKSLKLPQMKADIFYRTQHTITPIPLEKIKNTSRNYELYQEIDNTERCSIYKASYRLLHYKSLEPP